MVFVFNLHNQAFHQFGLSKYSIEARSIVNKQHLLNVMFLAFYFGFLHFFRKQHYNHNLAVS